MRTMPVTFIYVCYVFRRCSFLGGHALVINVQIGYVDEACVDRKYHEFVRLFGKSNVGPS